MASVGDLYVNLGVKGSEKTVGALTDVKKGFGEITSMSIEAKAAILAAVYGFEQLMSASGHMGTALLNSSTLLGMSTQTLQQYQYAARQAGASNEEMTSTFKTLSGAMASIKVGQGLPEGLKFISNAIGGIDIERAKRDIPYFFQKLQQFATSNVPADLKRKMLSGLVSDNVMAGMERNMFRDDVFAKAPTYSDGQVKGNDRSRAAWSNLATQVEMAFGKFNAKHGAEFANDLSKIVTQIEHLANALVELGESVHFFETFTNLMEKLSSFLSAVPDAAKLIGGLFNGPDEAGKSAKILWDKTKVGAKEAWKLGTANIGGHAQLPPGWHAPMNINVQQTITHHGDAKDTHSVGQTHHAAAKNAHAPYSKQTRTSPSQTGGY